MLELFKTVQSPEEEGAGTIPATAHVMAGDCAGHSRFLASRLDSLQDGLVFSFHSIRPIRKNRLAPSPALQADGFLVQGQLCG